MTTDFYSDIPKRFEVWRMAFKFEDKPNVTKERPVVIGAVSSRSAEVFVLSVKVTSHAPRSDWPGEVILLDWKEAGLEKPSVARCSKHMVVPIETLLGNKKYGRLSERDALAVEKALHEVRAPLL